MQENGNRPFDEKERIQQLERLSEIADTKLGVVEDMRWVVAGLMAAVIYQWSHNSYYTIGAYVLTWWLTALSYRRDSDKAEDAYYRAAKLGKYVEPRRPSTDESNA